MDNKDCSKLTRSIRAAGHGETGEHCGGKVAWGEVTGWGRLVFWFRCGQKVKGDEAVSKAVGGSMVASRQTAPLMYFLIKCFWLS